jgi:hypothetical protein
MSKHFLTSFLLLTLFLLGTVFLLLPNTEPKDYFPFISDQELSLKTHVHFLFNNLKWVVIAIVIIKETELPSVITYTFFGLMLLRLADYLLTYNEVWFKIYDFPLQGSVLPITCNTTSCLIFGIAILYHEFKWSNQQINK